MKYIESPGMDPYFNLALEEHLMLHSEPGERILYLWQNDRTVVIGRNQDPRRECRTELMEREGVKLARRKSGGGAVYHDRGNLNFTFIAHEAESDPERQLRAVTAALSAIGVDAVSSGRNDILVDGRKVSGNAFYKSGGVCCHHGTVMVDVDLGAVDRYLTPSAGKLSSKSVPSARSRVADLKELDPNITVDVVKEALRESCGQAFGRLETIRLEELDRSDILERMSLFADPRWLFPEERRLGQEISRRFSWGEVSIRAETDGGRIRAVRVRTDAMDPDLSGKLEAALTGAELTCLAGAVRRCAGVEKSEEIAEWLSETPLGG